MLKQVYFRMNSDYEIKDERRRLVHPAVMPNAG
jgi:hypothetical protein